MTSKSPLLSSPRYGDPLGLGSWDAPEPDDDGLRKHDQSIRAYTPDLCRRGKAAVLETGPPGSAPPWIDNGDAQHNTAAHDGQPNCQGFEGSKGILHEVWSAFSSEDGRTISKATYMRLHFEINRIIEESKVIASSAMDPEPCDSRSVVEMNWAANAKGRTIMDFGQFEQAWLAMAEGPGGADEERYRVFCSAAREACCTTGEGQMNHPAHRSERSGAVSPGSLSPGTPLRGSFPAGLGQPSDAVLGENGGSLLTSARPGAGQQAPVQPCPADLAGSFQEKSAVAPRTVDETICTGHEKNIMPAGAVADCPGSVVQGSHRLKADSLQGMSVESTSDGVVVLARGMFATPPHPRVGGTGVQQGPEIDTRLLAGSASQKALHLQRELRHHRVRLMELQRHSGRGPAALALEASDLARRKASSGKQGYTQSATATDPNNSGGPIPGSSPPTAKSSVMPESLLCCAALGSSTELHHAAGSDSAADLSRREGGQAVMMDGNASSQGSLASSTVGGDSLLTGGGSRSARTRGTHARLLGDPERQMPHVPAREKVLVMPCRPCRQREAALWCSECRSAFCVSCFDKVPHHRGTGLVTDTHRRTPTQANPSLPPSPGALACEKASVMRARDINTSGGKTQREPAGRLRLGRTKATAKNKCGSEGPLTDQLRMEMEGNRTGAYKGRRKSRRASVLLNGNKGTKVAVLPQDELAAFRSIPALCLNSGADGVCSARDFHNNKYALAAAKAVAPRGLPLDFSKGKGRYNYGGGRSLGGGYGSPDECGVVQDGGGGERGIKTFGGTTVRVVTS